MTINNYAGGLSVRLASHLINIDESVVCENVDITKGSLLPINGLLATTNTIPVNNDKFIMFKGSYISSNLAASFVEYNNSLYFTNNIGELQKTTDGTTIYNVGLTAPTTAPTVTQSTLKFNFSNNYSSTSSNLEHGTIGYLIEYKLQDGELLYKEITFDYSGSNGVKLTIDTSLELTFVKLYRNYNSKYRFVGETYTKAAITDITQNISTGATSVPLETNLGYRQYVYTYYSNTTKFESAPSPASDAIVDTTSAFTLSNFVLPTDSTITNIIIYRIGGLVTNFYSIATIDLATLSYIDTKSALEVLDGTLLETQGYTKPKSNLKYLVEFNSALFASNESNLYFSNAGLVDIWTDYNYIKFPEVITGLGVSQNGLLVFSQNKTWILTGTDISNYSRYLLNGNQGCVNNNTINYVENNLLWLSADGVCVSSGGSIEVLSWPKLGKLNIIPHMSEVYENQYFLFHTTGTIVIDFRLGVKFYTLDLIARGAYYNTDIDALQILKPDIQTIYLYNRGTTLTYKYKTGKIAENGLTNYKSFKDIYIYATGTNHLKVYIDEELTNSIDLKEGCNNIKVIQNKHKGYFIEFEFEGTGTIKEINLVTEGRQNGR